ncbi:glycosyltransferase [Phnomibacter sp. MR]|uniref:glycosyltransferase n=1 Tax=Phnomibacter sp. MR TaxID=3042318 RepID=UPI003A800330
MLYVVIATAFNRTEWLIRRSLLSVYRQTGIDAESVQVIVVDDNDNPSIINNIRHQIEELRQELQLNVNAFTTQVIRNEKAPYRSGTGAWNTAIYMAHAAHPDSFIAMLDDDDEYLPHHLADCMHEVQANAHIDAVFQELEWLMPDGNTWPFPLTKEDIHPLSFYIGNPGVQGSNLFVRTQTLLDIHAFDESFESTTDRDLMIRLIRYWQSTHPNAWQQQFQVLSRVGVIHHEHTQERVTTNINKKQKGLAQFYQKFRQDFSLADYHKSVKRASLLFQYKGDNTADECIVLLMAMHNNAGTVENAIRSVMSQRATRRPVFLLIADDASTDDGCQLVEQLSLEFPNIFLVKHHFGNIAANRNALQRQAKEKFPNAVLYGRLDADDSICEAAILQRIEQLWDSHHFDVLLMANHQYLGDAFTGYSNRPDESLLNPVALLARLKNMADEQWEAELPSCNVFIRPQVAITYAEMPSAEDHRNLVDYLLQSKELNISIQPDWVYCNYRIDKHVNASEKAKEIKRSARVILHQYALDRLYTREQQAEAILQQWKPGVYHLLGAGSAGVVFQDGVHVYKVYLLHNGESLQQKKYLIDQIRNSRSQFEDAVHFYPILDVIEWSALQFIVVYPYEPATVCTGFEADEIQDFLVECWQKRLIFQDVKPANFIRVNGRLKWIDYEPDKFTDNLFLNMVARAFIYATYTDKEPAFLTKLCRSAINQFDLPELHGLQAFANRVFAKIVWQESQPIVGPAVTHSFITVDGIEKIVAEGCYAIPYEDAFNAESCFHQLRKQQLYLEQVLPDGMHFDAQNYFAPKQILLSVKEITSPKQKVSLVIKACVQDAEIIYQAVQHIIRQLSYPNRFEEVLLALDNRTEDFLRQYNGNNTWEQLVAAANRLAADGLIDRFVFPKQEDIVAINKAWFGLDTNHSHTIHKVPVAAQLFAFEQAQCDFILQMDCDVLIGRSDKRHSFLNDMIAAITDDENVLSVGFNIFKGTDASFTPYCGRENGGFVPEVRCCLLQKSKLKKLLPLHNFIEPEGLGLSWYRSLERTQKETGYCSVRGGDSRSFFIHPQNYRKANKDVWFTILDRVEQLHIPARQRHEFDLAGSYYDWTIPHRNEPLVLVSCFRNISLARFLRFWYSLLAQTEKNWGLILIDDASENGISYFIKALMKPYQHKVTYIENRFRMGVAHNTYKAIHYCMQQPDSIVCVLDADDALMGKKTLQNIAEKYSIWKADVVLGNMYRTDKLHPHYQYTPNFIQPRAYGGNVWQHIRSFRKYLFDSLSFDDLKIERANTQTDDILLAKRFSVKMTFPEHCWDYTYMVPIVEMSENPMWMNHFNVLHDRTTVTTPALRQIKNNIIAEVLAKPAKTPKDVLRGRKTFLPNTNKIELDITYDCNLKCFHCNRSCTQAPTQAHMRLEQVQQFVHDSIALGKKWQLINVLGGEPTLHPQFAAIVHCLLYEYLIPHSPDTILQITSNGHGQQVQQQLQALPVHANLVIDHYSFKDDRAVPYFSPFNLAPVDEPDAQRHEYHKGCWVTAYCGIGLNHLGYFACGVAGGIERLLQAGKGIARLEDVEEHLLQQQLNSYCSMCGNYTAYAANRGDFMERAEKDNAPKTAMSDRWKQLYKQYNQQAMELVPEQLNAVTHEARI